MKKEKIVGLIFFITILISLLLVNAQADLIRPTKTLYNTGESVAVSSTVSSTDKLCRSSANENVKIYITENKESWAEGDDLTDVRENPSEVPNARFSSKKIWENIKVGDYDIIVDCNDNQKYDLEDPIFNQDIKITQKTGVGKVTTLSAVDTKWNYDPEEIVLTKEILFFKALAQYENIKLQDLIISFQNEKELDIENIQVYADKNKDNTLNAVDAKIGELILEKPITSGESKTLTLDYTLNQDIEDTIIIVVTLKEATKEGNFYITLKSVSGTGELSNELIRFTGLPIESGKFQVTPKKSCVGTVNLNLVPNPAEQGNEISLSINNLTGCDKKIVSIKEIDCSNSGGEIKACTLTNNECRTTVKASRNTTYYACLDKNSNKDYTDFGESTSKELIVNTKESEKTEVEIKTEPIKENEKTEQEEPTITGKVTENKTTEEEKTPFSFKDQSSFMILLEVTLLLMLFVLVLILFKLKSPSEPEIKEKSEFAEDIIEENKDTEQKKEPSQNKKPGRKDNHDSR